MTTTTKAAHTPGPWKVETDEWGVNVYRPSVGIGTLYICESVQSKADARLIAAAPEMLEALQLALDEIHEFNLANKYANKPRNPELTQEAELKIKAAIQKARGGR